LRLPLQVLVEEALQAARFLERRWTTQRGRRGEVRTPGLDLVEGAGLISERTRHELVELVAALREASGRARLARRSRARSPSETGSLSRALQRAYLQTCEGAARNASSRCRTRSAAL